MICQGDGSPKESTHRNVEKIRAVSRQAMVPPKQQTALLHGNGADLQKRSEGQGGTMYRAWEQGRAHMMS